jgi:hypothetical protein
VRVRILEDAAPEDLVELADWLGDSPLVRRVSVVAGTADPEAQGGILDTVQALLTDAASVATVTDLVYRWVSVKRRKPETVQVEADGDDAPAAAVVPEEE